MTNIYLIENKITSIKKNLKILKGFRKHSIEALRDEITLHGAVKWYLYLVLQDSIYLAEAVISFKDFRKPTSYSENFEILHEEKFISSELKEKLAKMTGFRNLVIHEYGKLNFEKINHILHNNLKDIENFAEQIKLKLKI